ncbi:MAG TPA: PIG-L family deacetylase [Candidatus Binatia bacterium]|nr:PIG-L family deacetylase [Candidatus Binatia bacterium]
MTDPSEGWWSSVLGPHARVLVIAPHPDDETLGCGGLLARAAAHGAAIRVLVVTDGESNPWAQRAAECRWQIGEENEVRWGARRRDETMAAVEALGVDAAALRFLGFADQGLTRLLLGGGGGSIDVLAAKIAAFAPTVVVGPDLDDRHPDHSALAVLLTLACERCAGSIPFARLAYLVHGRVGPGDRMRLTLDRATRARKHRAAFAHASQLAALVRRLGPAPRRETFLDPRTGAGHPVRHAVLHGATLRLEIAMPRPRLPLRMPWLHVVADGDGPVVASAMPLALPHAAGDAREG